MKYRHLVAGLATFCFLNASGAAHTQPHNVHGEEPIGGVRAVYDGALMPDIQANTFRNIDRLFAVNTVQHGDSVYPLPYHSDQITALEFNAGERTYDLVDYVTLNRVSGLLVIKDGEIRHESYHLGNNEHTRWMSMSVVKAMASTLVGAAIKDGYIKSLNDAVVTYLPELKGTAYDGVSVRNLIQMASGVAWDETYTNPASDRRALLEAQIAQKDGAMLAVMSGLDRAAAPGTRWNYSTGETQVTAALIRAAVGRSLSAYLSEKVWARFGMEADASWWLNAPGGIEIGGSGLSATLRDYGRFGLFLMKGGIADGEGILPDGWVGDASTPKRVGTRDVNYGYMLWPVANSAGTIHDGAYEARGIFGQRIYMNPRENLVIVAWGARPKPSSRATVPDYDFLAAMARRVRGGNTARLNNQ